MSRRPPASAFLSSALILALVAAAPASAQSAEEVVNDALDRFEQRMEGVQSYTVVQTAMGFESSTTFERRTVDGHTVFVPRETQGSEAASRTPQSYQAMLTELGERGTHEGVESVDGRECHLLSLDDFSGGAFGDLSPSGDGGEWTPERLRVWIDRDELLPRKMTMEGTVTREGEERPVTITALPRDYREVDGVVHPYRTEVRTEGLSPSMSPEERERMKASMEKMKKKMEQMSPEQREMMEQMMGGRLEKMEEMLATGAMDMTVEVKEIRVNEGGDGGG
jgi:flavin-binding protein dodecin